MNILKDKKIGKIKSYVISGIVTTAISWVTYKVFLMLDIQYAIAFTLSWIIAVTYAYLSTRKKVYESKNISKKEVSIEYIRFCIGRVVTYLLNLSLLYIAVDKLGMDEFYSNCVITVIVIILNFFIGNISINKKWGISL